MIHVFIADDHPVVREGLKRLLVDHPDITISGEAESADDVLHGLEGATVDVLLLDVTMPGPGFIETMRCLRSQHPAVKVLVLSVHSEDQYARRALRLGAAGYLTKDQSPRELVAAIRRVDRGGRYVSVSLAEQLAADLASGREGPSHERLSDREYEVLCLMSAGKATKEIAAQLNVSPKTVSTYRARLLEKLELKTTADLIRFAVEQGLT
jgi:two-component system, NarL family, invasion response regulator UvrY